MSTADPIIRRQVMMPVDRDADATKAKIQQFPDTKDMHHGTTPPQDMSMSKRPSQTLACSLNFFQKV